jgi:hypothetical protein
VQVALQLETGLPGVVVGGVPGVGIASAERVCGGVLALSVCGHGVSGLVVRGAAEPKLDGGPRNQSST